MRAKRLVRRSVRIKLTERDTQILKVLARFRLAPTSALVAVAFPRASRQAAQHRLRALFDAGFVDVRVGNMAGSNIYALTTRGRTLLVDRGVRVGRTPQGVPPHHLDVVRAWVGIAQATRELGWKLQFMPEWETRRTVRSPVVPDGLAEFTIPCPGGEPHRLQLALEVDRSTESPQTFRTKLGRYGLLGSGADADLVLGLALHGASEKRVAALTRLLKETWPGHAALWTDRDGPHAALEELGQAVAANCCSGCNEHERGSDGTAMTPQNIRTGH